MKKVLISLILIIFIISTITSAYAATSSISAKASADTIVKGKTFTVTIAATSDSPIDGMKTKFSYDKNVLNLESATAGENYGNNSSDDEILVTSNADISPTSATLYTITFKVLDTANVDNTTISFSESELHLKTEETIEKFSTTIDNVTINIKADDTTVGGQDGTGDNGNQGGTENNPSSDGNNNSNGDNSSGSGTKDETKEETKDVNKDTNTNKNTNTNTNTNKNTNKNTTKLPQTGAESTSLIAIVILSIVAAVSYKSYSKYNNI